MKNERKTGTREWSEFSSNLFVGCEHNCRYCYARQMAMRSGRIHKLMDWMTPTPLRNIKSFTKRVSGVIMFPTTHDITMDNVLPCLDHLQGMLAAGNRVLIVTKPCYGAVAHLCRHLLDWKKQVEWRFTIGAYDDDLLAYWEPGAPSYEERIETLQLSEAYGYARSVSIEPMLDPTNLQGLLSDLRVHGASSYWIGKLNQVRRRVRIETEEDRRQVERIEAGQTDEKIMALVNALKADPLIRWKDSIREVMERHGMGTAPRSETQSGTEDERAPLRNAERDGG